MKTLPEYLLPILFLATQLLSESVAAQTDSIPGRSEVQIGIKYTSDYLYMGRSDSVKAPYLSAAVEYIHRSGFFASGALSYLTASDQGRIDLLTLSGGYDYYGTNFLAGVSLSEYFFSDLSYTVQSEMKTYLSAYAAYDFSAFVLHADVNLGFSDNTDVFLGTEINRTFYMLQSRLRLTPLVMINAGTQQYYSEYYTYRSSQTGKGAAKGKGGGPSGQGSATSVSVLESNSFKILDYEAAMRITYRFGNWRLFGQATWAFPVNPSRVTSDAGTYTEELHPGFYWSSGIRVSF
ncbi:MULTISPECIES: hypothetical protein [unclassified Imperialibacter]|uniref:hypothetical protein n=1 Tax=unclassified Imperialibacter TaxID=2629706 RepID=UPI001251AF94|nr:MULTISPECIES: hypothetical protein [unclassified Imperialibacter]CAD5255572.1 conserved hypothetical protein [Imperialibacter sp. 89]CAD5261654.1 conserved hypothetical protein [Imperialibacter sp. 75]VVT32797.1 conserved hypothetical protein [Imperialibacter sp. EC-SDR9]